MLNAIGPKIQGVDVVPAEKPLGLAQHYPELPIIANGPASPTKSMRRYLARPASPKCHGHRTNILSNIVDYGNNGLIGQVPRKNGVAVKAAVEASSVPAYAANASAADINAAKAEEDAERLANHDNTCLPRLQAHCQWNGRSSCFQLLETHPSQVAQ